MIIKPLFALLSAPYHNAVFDESLNDKRSLVGNSAYAVEHKDKQNVKRLLSCKVFYDLNFIAVFSSINSMLASVNCLLDFLVFRELRVKTVKMQRNIFRPEEKELEYIRLVNAAHRKGSERLCLILQTICGKVFLQGMQKILHHRTENTGIFRRDSPTSDKIILCGSKRTRRRQNIRL